MSDSKPGSVFSTKFRALETFFNSLLAGEVTGSVVIDQLKKDADFTVEYGIIIGTFLSKVQCSGLAVKAITDTEKQLVTDIITLFNQYCTLFGANFVYQLQPIAIQCESWSSCADVFKSVFYPIIDWSPNAILYSVSDSTIWDYIRKYAQLPLDNTIWGNFINNHQLMIILSMFRAFLSLLANYLIVYRANIINEEENKVVSTFSLQKAIKHYHNTMGFVNDGILITTKDNLIIDSTKAPNNYINELNEVNNLHEKMFSELVKVPFEDKRITFPFHLFFETGTAKAEVITKIGINGNACYNPVSIADHVYLSRLQNKLNTTSTLMEMQASMDLKFVLVPTTIIAVNLSPLIGDLDEPKRLTIESLPEYSNLLKTVVCLFDISLIKYQGARLPTSATQRFSFVSVGIFSRYMHEHLKITSSFSQKLELFVCDGESLIENGQLFGKPSNENALQCETIILNTVLRRLSFKSEAHSSFVASIGQIAKVSKYIILDVFFHSDKAKIAATILEAIEESSGNGAMIKSLQPSINLVEVYLSLPKTFDIKKKTSEPLDIATVAPSLTLRNILQQDKNYLSLLKKIENKDAAVAIEAKTQKKEKKDKTKKVKEREKEDEKKAKKKDKGEKKDKKKDKGDKREKDKKKENDEKKESRKKEVKENDTKENDKKQNEKEEDVKYEKTPKEKIDKDEDKRKTLGIYNVGLTKQQTRMEMTKVLTDTSKDESNRISTAQSILIANYILEHLPTQFSTFTNHKSIMNYLSNDDTSNGVLDAFLSNSKDGLVREKKLLDYYLWRFITTRTTLGHFATARLKLVETINNNEIVITERSVAEDTLVRFNYPCVKLDSTDVVIPPKAPYVEFTFLDGVFPAWDTQQCIVNITKDKNKSKEIIREVYKDDIIYANGIIRYANGNSVPGYILTEYNEKLHPLTGREEIKFADARRKKEQQKTKNDRPNLPTIRILTRKIETEKSSSGLNADSMKWDFVLSGNDDLKKNNLTDYQKVILKKSQIEMALMALNPSTDLLTYAGSKSFMGPEGPSGSAARCISIPFDENNKRGLFIMSGEVNKEDQTQIILSMQNLPMGIQYYSYWEKNQEQGDNIILDELLRISLYSPSFEDKQKKIFDYVLDGSISCVYLECYTTLNRITEVTSLAFSNFVTHLVPTRDNEAKKLNIGKSSHIPRLVYRSTKDSRNNTNEAETKFKIDELLELVGTSKELHYPLDISGKINFMTLKEVEKDNTTPTELKLSQLSSNGISSMAKQVIIDTVKFGDNLVFEGCASVGNQDLLDSLISLESPVLQTNTADKNIFFDKYVTSMDVDDEETYQNAGNSKIFEKEKMELVSKRYKRYEERTKEKSNDTNYLNYVELFTTSANLINSSAVKDLIIESTEKYQVAKSQQYSFLSFQTSVLPILALNDEPFTSTRMNSTILFLWCYMCLENISKNTRDEKKNIRDKILSIIAPIYCRVLPISDMKTITTSRPLFFKRDGGYLSHEEEHNIKMFGTDDFDLYQLLKVKMDTFAMANPRVNGYIPENKGEVYKQDESGINVEILPELFTHATPMDYTKDTVAEVLRKNKNKGKLIYTVVSDSLIPGVPIPHPYTIQAGKAGLLLPSIFIKGAGELEIDDVLMQYIVPDEVNTIDFMINYFLFSSVLIHNNPKDKRLRKEIRKGNKDVIVNPCEEIMFMPKKKVAPILKRPIIAYLKELKYIPDFYSDKKSETDTDDEKTVTRLKSPEMADCIKYICKNVFRLFPYEDDIKYTTTRKINIFEGDETEMKVKLRESDFQKSLKDLADFNELKLQGNVRIELDNEIRGIVRGKCAIVGFLIEAWMRMLLDYVLNRGRGMKEIKSGISVYLDEMMTFSTYKQFDSNLNKNNPIKQLCDQLYLLGLHSNKNPTTEEDFKKISNENVEILRNEIFTSPMWTNIVFNNKTNEDFDYEQNAVFQSTENLKAVDVFAFITQEFGYFFFDTKLTLESTNDNALKYNVFSPILVIPDMKYAFPELFLYIFPSLYIRTIDGFRDMMSIENNSRTPSLSGSFPHMKYLENNYNGEKMTGISRKVTSLCPEDLKTVINEIVDEEKKAYQEELKELDNNSDDNGSGSDVEVDFDEVTDDEEEEEEEDEDANDDIDIEQIDYKYKRLKKASTTKNNEVIVESTVDIELDDEPESDWDKLLQESALGLIFHNLGETITNTLSSTLQLKKKYKSEILDNVFNSFNNMNIKYRDLLQSLNEQKKSKVVEFTKSNCSVFEQVYTMLVDDRTALADVTVSSQYLMPILMVLHEQINVTLKKDIITILKHLENRTEISKEISKKKYELLITILTDRSVVPENDEKVDEKIISITKYFEEYIQQIAQATDNEVSGKIRGASLKWNIFITKILRESKPEDNKTEDDIINNITSLPALINTNKSVSEDLFKYFDQTKKRHATLEKEISSIVDYLFDLIRNTATRVYERLNQLAPIVVNANAPLFTLNSKIVLDDIELLRGKLKLEVVYLLTGKKNAIQSERIGIMVMQSVARHLAAHFPEHRINTFLKSPTLKGMPVKTMRTQIGHYMNTNILEQSRQLELKKIHKTPQVCHVCASVARLQCGGCVSRSYCSNECSKYDWVQGEHQHVCGDLQ